MSIKVYLDLLSRSSALIQPVCLVAMVTLIFPDCQNKEHTCCVTSQGERAALCHLDVDEVLALLDHVHVGVVDGLLVVFDASGPIRG